MSASESGATMTQSTGEPRPEGRSVGRKGAARRGSGAARGLRGGSCAHAEGTRTEVAASRTRRAGRVLDGFLRRAKRESEAVEQKIVTASLRLGSLSLI